MLHITEKDTDSKIDTSKSLVNTSDPRQIQYKAKPAYINMTRWFIFCSTNSSDPLYLLTP